MKSLRHSLSETAPALIGFALVSVLQFGALFDSKRAMEAGDAPPARAHDQQANLEAGFRLGWNPYAGPGAAGEVAPPDWQTLVYRYAHEMKAAEIIMAISLILGATFFFLFLRERGYSPAAAALGGLVFGFSSSIATFTYAGHVGRFAMNAYAAGAFWTAQRALNRRSIASAVWAGLFMAYTMMNDGTTGLLLMLGLALLMLRDLIVLLRTEARVWRTLILPLAAMGIVALATIMPQASYLKTSLEAGADLHAREEGGAPQWQWATQWSYPPQELLGFISPGYYGLDSFNRDQPYWGRLGRSFDWESTHQGFPNFSQTNPYLGLIPIIFLFSGLWLNLRRWSHGQLHDSPDAPPADTVFWLVLGLFSLLTAFGRFFPPPFQLFTSLPLPLISSFRNPVKFLVLINLCTAVLAAQGMESILQSLRQPVEAARSRALRVLAVVAAVFAVLFMGLLMGSPWTTPAFQAAIATTGHQDRMAAIISGMRNALLVGFGWSTLVALFVGLATVPSIRVLAGRPLLLPVTLLVLVGFDSIGVNRRYVRYQDAAIRYGSNAIIDDVRAESAYRVQFVPPSMGPFRDWAAQHSRLHEFRSVDGEGAPAGILPLLQVLSNNPVRLADLLGIRHIVIPRQYTNAVAGILGPDAIETRSYNISQRQNGALDILPAQSGIGPFVLVQNPSAFQTPRWYARAETASEADALLRIADPSFDPAATLLVDAPVVETATAIAPGAGGTFTLKDYSHNQIAIEGLATAPGWLLVNDPYHPAWQAEVNGKPVPIHRAFGVFRAIALPPGEQKITLTYRPKETLFWLPLTGVGIATLVSVAALALGKIRKPAVA